MGSWCTLFVRQTDKTPTAQKFQMHRRVVGSGSLTPATDFRAHEVQKMQSPEGKDQFLGFPNPMAILQNSRT